MMLAALLFPTLAHLTHARTPPTSHSPQAAQGQQCVTVADGLGHAGRSSVLRLRGTGQPVIFFFLSLSLSHFNSVYVRLSLSLPSSSHLLISPRLVASSPPAGVKEAKKRS